MISSLGKCATNEQESESMIVNNATRLGRNVLQLALPAFDWVVSISLSRIMQ